MHTEETASLLTVPALDSVRAVTPAPGCDTAPVSYHYCTAASSQWQRNVMLVTFIFAVSACVPLLDAFQRVMYPVGSLSQDL